MASDPEIPEPNGEPGSPGTGDPASDLPLPARASAAARPASTRRRFGQSGIAGEGPLTAPPPPLWLEPFRPGMRVAVAVSAGADSVALLRALAGRAAGLGFVLSVAHMHHGIRRADAEADAEFVAGLAGTLGLRLHRKDVDTPALASADRLGLEEAARILRYGWFAELLASGLVDAVATAHTLDDQAETVLQKLLRGAWTEGLGGIHPALKPAAGASTGATFALPANGQILRPLLGATREQIVAWLTAIRQPWREDATNADLAYTRNRIRHQLLPQLATYNPRIAQQLAQLATLARDEDAYWQKEVDRLLPAMLLPGRAVRGGGRATSTLPGERSLAIEVERLRGLHPALLRRLLREAAQQLGVALDFEETARLVALVEGGVASRREELTGELRAERTPRELRLLFTARHAQTAGTGSQSAAVEIPVPGEGQAFGWRVRCSLAALVPGDSAAAGSSEPRQVTTGLSLEERSSGNALLRAALPGDRVQLRYSRGAPKRIKEVLERMGVAAHERGAWPVLIWQGEIVWLRGAVLEPTAISRQLSLEAEIAAGAEAGSPE